MLTIFDAMFFSSRSEYVFRKRKFVALLNLYAGIHGELLELLDSSTRELLQTLFTLVPWILFALAHFVRTRLVFPHSINGIPCPFTFSPFRPSSPPWLCLSPPHRSPTILLAPLMPVPLTSMLLFTTPETRTRIS
jgi:hypothetical protein